MVEKVLKDSMNSGLQEMTLSRKVCGSGWGAEGRCLTLDGWRNLQCPQLKTASFGWSSLIERGGRGTAGQAPLAVITSDIYVNYDKYIPDKVFSSSQL